METIESYIPPCEENPELNPKQQIEILDQDENTWDIDVNLVRDPVCYTCMVSDECASIVLKSFSEQIWIEAPEIDIQARKTVNKF